MKNFVLFFWSPVMYAFKKPKSLYLITEGYEKYEYYILQDQVSTVCGWKTSLPVFLQSHMTTITFFFGFPLMNLSLKVSPGPQD